MQFVQRAVGYSLTGNTREQVIFIAHGTGRNGKSTFTTTLLSLLGEYGQQTPTETLMVKRGDSIPNDLARLKGTRLVAAMESDEGRRLSEALIKQLSGGDRIPARFMRAEWFEFQPTFKIWLATNHKPVIRGTDLAIWRRIRLVPFTVTISEQEEDKQLGEKLQAEFPGILRWAVEGCLAWQQHGLGMPEAVKNATAGYREEMDVLGAWVAECCVIEPNAKAGAKELYASYTAWCEAGGERALSQRAFGLQLGERGFERYRGTGKKHMWRGIGLKSDPYDPAPDDRDPMGPSRFPNTDVENDQVGTHRDPDSRLNSLYLPRKGLCRNQGPLGPSQDNDEALEEEEWVG
jgi:putative DNA primase/helicase